VAGSFEDANEVSRFIKGAELFCMGVKLGLSYQEKIIDFV
jgi:hypothetical protein